MKKVFLVGIMVTIILLFNSTTIYADVIGPNGEINSRPTWESIVDYRTFEVFFEESGTKASMILAIFGTLVIILGLVILTLNNIKQEKDSNLKSKIKSIYLAASIILNVLLINLVKDIRLYICDYTLISSSFEAGTSKFITSLYVIYAIIMMIFGIQSINKKNTKSLCIVTTVMNVIFAMLSVYTLKFGR